MVRPARRPRRRVASGLSAHFRHRRGDWMPPAAHRKLPMPITCPACHDLMQEPAARVGPVAVCPNCGRSFVITEDGPAHLATAADTVPLTEAERTTLRRARCRRRA